VPHVVFILPDQTERTIEVRRGESPMQAAVHGNLDGILGECGGVLTCSTCHVYVEPAWIERLPAPREDELDMLGFTAAERRDNSRLSCQIRMTDALDGIRLALPPCQI
jgi:ferredoxin, 2Fe-2S